MEQFVISFLLTSLAMTAIILVISVFNVLFGKTFTAKSRYAVWLIVLIGLVIPLRPVIGDGIVTIPLPASAQTQSSESSMIEAPPITAPYTLLDRPASPFMVCVFVWGIVAIMVFACHIRRYVRFLRTIQRWGTTVKDGNILSILRAVQAEKGLSNKKIGLKICGFVSSSMLTGFWRPMILLPEKHFETDELELIFRHELIHYKRRDLFINFLSVAAISMHWFNPIIYWMCAAMQMDGEISCDEAVLLDSNKENRRFYAEVIIGMISERSMARTMLSTCFYGGKSSIRRRLEVIMDTTRKIKPPAILVLVAITTLTLLSGSVFAIQEPSLPIAPRVVPEAIASGKITIKQAEEIALAAVGEGTLRKAKLDVKKGIYKVEIRDDRRDYEVTIDSATGEIIKNSMKERKR